MTTPHRAPRRSWLLALPLVGGAVLAGCVSEAERASIDDWLGCIDHCDDERDSVGVLFGSSGATSELADALRGPSAERRENMRQQFAAAYALVEDPSITQDEYTEFFLENYEATVQTRAIVALGDFADSGNTDALDALRDALREDSAGVRGYRDDVRLFLERVIVRREGIPFDGDLDRDVSFLDTVVARQGAAIAFNNEESVILHGAPFPDDLTVTNWNDSVSFVAVGDVGTYALSIRNPPIALDASDSLTISSFTYTPNEPLTAENLGTGPFPRRIYLALTDAEPDDYYRVEPAWDANVTAIADWSGPAEIAVLVDDCDAFILPSNVEIDLTVLDENGDPLSGIEVLLGSTLLGTTDARGHFQIPSSAFGFVPPPTALVRLRSGGQIVGQRTIPLGTADAVFTVLPPGQAAPAFSRPDTTRATVPASTCGMIRLHRLPGRPEPAIVRLWVQATPTGPDNTPPVFGALNPAPVGNAGTDAAAIVMTIGTVISDQSVIGRADLTVLVDGTEANGTGANAACDPATDWVLDPAAAEIDRNGIDLTDGTNLIDFTGAAREAFTVNDPFGAGLGGTVTYCFVIDVEDDVVPPNGDRLVTAVDVVWNP